MKKKKTRKRTNKDIPAKGRLRDFADTLWSRAVKLDWAGKCAACGKGSGESHHIFPRAWEATRYDLENGLFLCWRHHMTDNEMAPHQNAPGFMDWMEDHLPGRYEWVQSSLATNLHKSFNGTKDAWHYIEVIKELQPQLPGEDFAELAAKMGFVRFVTYLDTKGQKAQ